MIIDRFNYISRKGIEPTHGKPVSKVTEAIVYTAGSLVVLTAAGAIANDVDAWVHSNSLHSTSSQPETPKAQVIQAKTRSKPILQENPQVIQLSETEIKRFHMMQTFGATIDMLQTENPDIMPVQTAIDRKMGTIVTSSHFTTNGGTEHQRTRLEVTVAKNPDSSISSAIFKVFNLPDIAKIPETPENARVGFEMDLTFEASYGILTVKGLGKELKDAPIKKYSTNAQPGKEIDAYDFEKSLLADQARDGVFNSLFTIPQALTGKEIHLLHQMAAY